MEISLENLYVHIGASRVNNDGVAMQDDVNRKSRQNVNNKGQFVRGLNSGVIS